MGRGRRVAERYRGASLCWGRRVTFDAHLCPTAIRGARRHARTPCKNPCLPTPIEWEIYLGTIPGNPHPYLLPAADHHHATPIHLVEHLAVGPSPFLRRLPTTPSDGRPPDEPTHAGPGPKRAIVLLNLKAEATIPRDLELENTSWWKG